MTQAKEVLTTSREAGSSIRIHTAQGKRVTLYYTDETRKNIKYLYIIHNNLGEVDQ